MTDMKKIAIAFISMFCISVMLSPSATAAPKKTTGMISGEINHPAHRIPSVKICAVNLQTNKNYCVKTRPDQQDYQIRKLPAGEYQVIADDLSYSHEGGYMQQVQCIRAPCDPVPGNITLTAGQHFDKALISFRTPEKPESVPTKK
jgi:hypothetical protein